MNFLIVLLTSTSKLSGQSQLKSSLAMIRPAEESAVCKFENRF